MTVKFKIESSNAIVHLQAKKTMAGDIMIFDHPEIDVVISPAQNKVVAFSKEQYGSHVYATQSRLFDHLAKRGVVDPSTIHSGNVFGSLEGMILEVEEKQKENVNAIQTTIYSIAKFFEHEKGFYDVLKKYEDDLEDDLLHPDDADSTALGKIPHKPRKGSLNTYPGSTAAYGLVGQYNE